jgi:hypothetical protein
VAPWEWRRSGDSSLANTTASGCSIKGNINNKGDRIYHVPGSRYCAQTQVNESRGERWFCSEAEARAAGWLADIAPGRTSAFTNSGQLESLNTARFNVG